MDNKLENSFDKLYCYLDENDYVIGFGSGYEENSVEVKELPKIEHPYYYYKYSDGELKFDEEVRNREERELEKLVLVREQHLILNALQQQAFMTTLDDTQAYSVRFLYPTWEADHDYKSNERIIYNDKFYKVLQDHKSQSDWLPNEAVSLYVEVSDPNEEWPRWKQPLGVQDAYMKGDKVTFEDIKYISLIDNNTWSPKDYPQGWEEVDG